MGDPKDHLANERTFLAWIRTAIGIMAFGFLIARAAIFLKQMSSSLQQEVSLVQVREASLFGISLVILGVLITLLSLWNYRIVTYNIEQNNYRPPLILSLVLTLAILGMGGFLTFYLSQF